MDTKNTPNDNIAVVVPPPPLDIDAYHPFDEVYRHTVDEILSDEASFSSSSFDEYTGSVGDDGDGLKPDALPRGRGDGRARLSGKKKSPYFSGNGGDTGVKGKTAVAQREITRVDLSESETSPELEPNPEPVSGNQNEGVVDLEEEHARGGIEPKPEFVAQVDGMGEAPLEGEEDNLFASLGTYEQTQLNEFLHSHPFLKNSAYPVGRYARRHFVNELREKAGALGMDEHNINQLILSLKNLYLETWAVGHVVFNNDPNTSEFGDEYDDEEEMTRKEHKRKRRSGDKSKDKSKKSKRKSSELKENAIAPEEIKHEVIDIENTTPTPRVDDDLVAILVDLDNKTDDHSAHMQRDPAAPEFAKANRRSSENTKRRGHIDLGSQDDPIALDDDIVDDGCDSPTANIKESNAKHSTPAVSPVKPANGRNALNGNGHFSHMDSGLRDHPISLDDDDNSSKNDTGKKDTGKDTSKKDASKKDASKKDASKKDVNKNDVKKGTNPTPSEPTAENASLAKKEKNRRKRQRRKERRASYRASDAQPQSEQQPENHVQENGNDTNYSTQNNPNEDPLENYKLLDDPFWDL